MSTLLQAVGGGGDAHAGVKRPLSNPAAVGSEQTSFRGAQLSPPNEMIKAPKLDHSNRNDRGTNVTIPYARITALTSISQTKGRMSPGDVLFLKKTPSGYLGSNLAGSKHRFGNGQDTMGMMADVIGVDGLNRLLVGSLDKRRPWISGVNLLKRDDRSLQLDLNDISILRSYTLDGVIISNEEPFSFTGGARDGAVFNVAIKGPVKTNNGYLSYDSHSPTELYPRGFDTLAYQGAARLGLERSGDTWHSYLTTSNSAVSGMGGSDKGMGVDFVASFTNSFTKYPTQMFDRKAKMLDRAYIALREYNFYTDVVAPRAKYLTRGNPTLSPAQKAAKELEVINSLDLLNEDGTSLAMDLDDAKTYYFYQWMPCTSRAFQTYLHNKQRGGGGTHVVPGHNKFKRGTGANITPFTYKDSAIKETEFDAFRDDDVEHCVGAWLVGTIIDASSDRAGPFTGGPVSTAYRMNVNVGVRWVPRNYDIDTKGVGGFVDDTHDNMKSERINRFQDTASRGRGSDVRTQLGMQRVHTLAKMELHEIPHYYDSSGGPPLLTPAQQAKIDFDAAKVALDAAKAAYDGPPVSAVARPAYVAAANEMKAKADAYQLAAGGQTLDPLADQAVVDANQAIAAIPPAAIAPPGGGGRGRGAAITPQVARVKYIKAFAELGTAKASYETNRSNVATKRTYRRKFKAARAAAKAWAKVQNDASSAAAVREVGLEEAQAQVAGIDISSMAQDSDDEYESLIASAPIAAPVQPTAPSSLVDATIAAPARASAPARATAPSSLVDATIAARAASTAAAASATASSNAPAAAAAASSRPLVPTSTPTAAAARQTRAAAPKPAASGGIVDSVFSSMFGDLTSSAPAPAAASSSTSTPPSPTHPSGSGGAGGGESGPRVFQRRAR